MNTRTSTRDSRFELLRIISMLFIIAGHYAYHGGVLENSIGVNRVLGALAHAGVYIGVNCFVLVSAYFLLNTKFSVKRVVKIEAQALFYSSLAFLIACFYFHDSITGKEAVKVFLPTIFREYWFVTAYIGLLLLSPFLNYVIQEFTVNLPYYRNLLLVSTLMFSMIPFFMPTSTPWGNDLLWFVHLYFLMGYLKNRDCQVTSKARSGGMLFGLCFFCSFVSSIVFIWIANGIPVLNRVGVISYLSLYKESPFQLLGAIGLFLLFANIKMRPSKWINRIAATTFGVYLIHDNPLLRTHLWQDVLHTGQFYDSPFLGLHMIVSIAVVFLICSLVDEIRRWMGCALKGVNIFPKLQMKIDNLFNLHSDSCA
ncbi:acyltransferase [Anaeromassilibacillus senegalensis]|uniref:acyltransferase n=1 Tax=Anaeromassilibacillus senegalensis TaxID=1673717 RepID=UPI00068006AA|nr:acyltransferase [Anaeromassilibacillus senegalensis]